MAWMMPAAQMGMSLLSAGQDKGAHDDLMKQWNDINKYNAEQVAANNKANVGYGREILDMGTPDIRASQLGDLLFAQGQGASNKQNDHALQQAMMTNLRRGSGSGNADLQVRAANEQAGELGDRRAQSTLQGIQGVQPNQAALQVAGNLFHQQAPQMQMPGQGQASTAGAATGAIGSALGAFAGSEGGAGLMKKVGGLFG